MAKSTETEKTTAGKISDRILRLLDTGPVGKARSWIVKFPRPEQRRALTNERIIGSLKKLGVVTRSEIDALTKRVEKLETELARKRATTGKRQTNATDEESTKENPIL